jgi:hypothetical protein
MQTRQVSIIKYFKKSSLCESNSGGPERADRRVADVDKKMRAFRGGRGFLRDLILVVLCRIRAGGYN